MNEIKPTPVRYITIAADYAGQRVDNFLITLLKNVPKTRIYRLLRKGEVRINKKRVQPSYKLQAGDLLRVPPVKLDAPKTPLTPRANLVATLSERVLYEDKYLLIINKPSGIPVHGGSGVHMGLIEILRHMYSKIPHLELAHRLDLDTSGCLILAKKRSILKELHELMRSGKIHKVYLALTKGHWQESELKVEAPLQKNHLSSGERIVKVNKEGKASLTVFRQLATYPGASLVEATLHTGRTHQIRVHAQYRDHPLAGDEKYGDREFNKTVRQGGLKRLFLHASLIEFTLPSTGESYTVSAPLEVSLAEYLKTLA